MPFSNINSTLKIAKVLQTEILRRSWFFLHWCQLLKLTKEYFSKGIYGRTFFGELIKPGTYDKSRELEESLFFLTEKNGFFFIFLNIFISGVFQSYRHVTDDGTMDVYVDGGLLCNYPIHAFDGK